MRFMSFLRMKTGTCSICGKEHVTISNSIGVCVDCLRNNSEKALPIALKSHYRFRKNIRLPIEPPKPSNGKLCSYCGNMCRIPPNNIGFCGIISNDNGLLSFKTRSWKEAVGLYYLDPHPTNCVAEKVCPANTSRGYPKYTSSKSIEYGYYNLAVFYGGCNFDCLFCQNHDHKIMATKTRPTMTAEELYKASMNPRVTCICYFGGDPGPFAVHALYVSRKILKTAKEKGLIKRICWETNGYENPIIMKEMAKLSFESGGIVKIDFKAWTPEVYKALTGVDASKRVRENVKLVGKMFNERPEIPLLVVSILLVPGYVDVYEVSKIGKYVASINDKIPVVLLAFHPEHRLNDLPPTSRRHAEECLRELKKIGLKEIYIGNWWLLGNYY